MDYQEAIANLKEERKLEIIEQATNLFIEKGIYEVSMGDVANYCNIGTATLYRYYGSKNGLVIRCAEAIWDRLWEYLSTCNQNQQESNTGKERAIDSLKILLSMYKDKKQELCFIQNFDAFVCKQDITKENLKEYETKVELFYSFFRESYQKGLKDGSIREKENGIYEYLTIVHTLFCMSQKFAGGAITSHDGDERSLYELTTIVLLYQQNL